MKVLLLNGYSDSNKGDLAITEATVSLLKSKHPSCDIVLHSVFSINDEDFNYHNRFMKEQGVIVRQMIVPSPYIKPETNAADNVRAFIRLFKSYFLLLVYRNGFSKWVNKFSKKESDSLADFFTADYVYMKGGQFIYNDQGGIRGGLYLFRMLTPFFFRRDIVVLGQSIGPIEGKFANWLARLALSRAKVIYSREEVTSQYLTHNLKLVNVDRIPDLAFYYASRQIEDNKDKVSNRVGVTVVNWSFPESDNKTDKLKRYSDSIVNTVAYLIDDCGYEVDLIPQVTVKHHGSSDLDLIEKISKRVNSGNVNVIREDLSPQEMVDLYASYKFIIGTRLHSCILALCAGTPVIAIKYQGYKTQGIMAEVGLEDYVLDIYDISADAIRGKISKLCKERELLAKIISRKVISIRKEILEKSQSV